MLHIFAVTILIYSVFAFVFRKTSCRYLNFIVVENIVARTISFSRCNITIIHYNLASARMTLWKERDRYGTDSLHFHKAHFHFTPIANVYFIKNRECFAMRSTQTECFYL